MFAFIAENEEGEGVVAYQIDDRWVPLVGADMDRVKSYIPMAEDIATQTGTKIRLCYFTTRTEIMEIKP